MKASHTLARVSVNFDEDNLVPHGGLTVAGVLAQKLGLAELVDDHVTVAGEGAANAGAKAATVVGSALVGGDFIDDCVRHEALWYRAGCKASPPICRSRPGEAEGSSVLEVRERVGAALTTTGRIRTARWCGSG